MTISSWAYAYLPDTSTVGTMQDAMWREHIITFPAPHKKRSPTRKTTKAQRRKAWEDRNK